MDRNSNGYTFLFAAVLVIVVAAILSLVATNLKPYQQTNIKQEKMQNILATIGLHLSREEAEKKFKTYVKQQLALRSNGTVDSTVNAFDINLSEEVKKSPDKQRYPLYITEKGGQKNYVIPLWGAGLWNAIWGYVALKKDMNTIKGAVFDHQAETPGLGAEITQDWFMDQFKGKHILERSDAGFTKTNFVSVKTVKGGADANDPHGVDAISGGTITSDGLSAMIRERVKHYLPYFDRIKNNEKQQ